MKGLTKRQREIVDFIKEFIAAKHHSPSYREIAAHFGFTSVGSVYRHINVLKRKGLLNKESKSSRSLIPTEELSQQLSSHTVEVPFIGTIAGGIPIQLFSQTQTLNMPSTLVPFSDNTYAFRVSGDSLVEEHMVDGDILLVEARQQVHAGEMVVALINAHDTIVQKYYPEEDYIRFVGVHEHHHPIIVRQDDVVIQGVVVALFRKY